MGKATKGTTARKKTKVARRKNKLVKENATASNEPINFKETMIIWRFQKSGMFHFLP